MLIIRLQRTGAKNKPDFRLVLAEKHRAAKKIAKEILGQYNPRSKELRLRDAERLKMWIARNVELSATARNLLINRGLMEGQKVKAWRPKKSAQGGSLPVRQAGASGGKRQEEGAPPPPAEAPTASVIEATEETAT